MKNGFFLILFILTSCSSLKKDPPYVVKSIKLKPGEVRWVTLENPGTNGKFYCNNQEIPYLREGRTISAFLAESYFSKLKPFNCNYKTKEKDRIIARVSIEKKEFPFEKLNVDKKKVFYSKTDLKRIIKESKKLKGIYGAGDDGILFKGPFAIPLETKVTSIYGTKRLFNNNKNSQHLGTDYRAPVGTTIKVSNHGKVVLSEDLFFTGNTVIIDHGLGVFTMYGHLSKVSVKVGDKINKDQEIGLSGKTGRVTGPHLHWGVKVHGHWVDGHTLVDETGSL